MSSDFIHHAEINWCATVGVHNHTVALYENYWTDGRHYICQYDCKQHCSAYYFCCNVKLPYVTTNLPLSPKNYLSISANNLQFFRSLYCFIIARISFVKIILKQAVEIYVMYCYISAVDVKT